MNHNIKLYYCYSKELSKYLYDKGFRYLHKAKELKTNNIFSCYEVTPELSKALKEYK